MACNMKARGKAIVAERMTSLNSRVIAHATFFADALALPLFFITACRAETRLGHNKLLMGIDQPHWAQLCPGRLAGLVIPTLKLESIDRYLKSSPAHGKLYVRVHLRLPITMVSCSGGHK